jgi:hypothetical protein
MPLPARRRASLFGSKVSRAGTALRSPSEPHEVPTWRGDQNEGPERLRAEMKVVMKMSPAGMVAIAETVDGAAAA